MGMWEGGGWGVGGVRAEERRVGLETEFEGWMCLPSDSRGFGLYSPCHALCPSNRDCRCLLQLISFFSIPHHNRETGCLCLTFGSYDVLPNWPSDLIPTKALWSRHHYLCFCGETSLTARGSSNTQSRFPGTIHWFTQQTSTEYLLNSNYSSGFEKQSWISHGLCLQEN